MADIFFSYSSKDRERVRRVHEVLENMGFEIFWDQKTPAGVGWDAWIRKNLTQSKCAVVFWSEASVVSDNVHHEATIAKQQGKLISAFIEPLTAEDMPMGHYAQQAANLSDWTGDRADEQWRKFCDAVEAKLTPRWVQEKIGLLDAELEGQRARREAADAHEKRLRAQITKEVKIQEDLRRERDVAVAQVAELTGVIEERDRGVQAAIAKETETRTDLQKQMAKQEDLSRERDTALAAAAQLQAKLEELAHAHSTTPTELLQGIGELSGGRDKTAAQIRGLTVLGMLLIGLLCGLTGVWIGTRINDSSGASDPAAKIAAAENAQQDAESKLADANKARQAAERKASDDEKARQAAESKVADSEKARQTTEASAADTEKARQALAIKVADTEKAWQTAEAKAANAEKARQAAEAKLADAQDDAEKTRQAAVAKTADADKNRLAAETKPARPQGAGNPSQAANAQGSTPLFILNSNMVAKGDFSSSSRAGSQRDCEQICSRSEACKLYSYSKSGTCYTYNLLVDLVESSLFDSGVRATNLH